LAKGRKRRGKKGGGAKAPADRASAPGATVESPPPDDDEATGPGVSEAEDAEEEETAPPEERELTPEPAPPDEPPPSPRTSNGLSGFLRHLHPPRIRRRSAGPGATLGLGVATLVAVAVATVSGILLALYYVPSVAGAHASIQDLISVVPLGRFLRNLHRWSAHAAVALCVLHLLRTLLWGAYRASHARVWLVGVGLLILVLATSFSGYLLPWDQDAYWTVTVGTSLASYVPLVGDALQRLLLGGPEIGQATLTRFYFLHVLALPTLGALLLVLHLFRLRRAGGLARPPGAAGPGEALVPASPLLTSRELWLGAGLVVAMVLAALLVDARLGPLPDLVRPDNPPKAPWFLVGLQEMVGYNAAWGGFAFPALLLGLLALGPWLDGGRACDGAPAPGRGRRLLLLALLVLLTVAVVVAVRWWGDARLGRASWLNPASITTILTLALALIGGSLASGPRAPARGLALQAAALGLLALLGLLTVVGWFWRGPDWALTFHPGPGRPEGSRLTAQGSWRDRSADVLQVTTPRGAVDRCPTCHRKPHRAIEGHPRPGQRGCTVCHGGQGRRLDMQAHAPLLGAGPDPFLTGKRIQARCARCHVPTDLAGAAELGRGFQQYLDAACTGCHQPGRLDEGLGPDLRRLGRRTVDELKDALLRPRESHAGATMWSLAWRFGKGGRDLDALLTALLAMSDPPQPYRASWARPTLRVDVDCTSCHQEVVGQRTAGRPHRCTLLRETRALRCRGCHSDPSSQVKPAPGRECPQVRAARPLCAVCHLRGREDGAAP